MIDYNKVSPLAQFMIKSIATNPENRNEDGTVDWNFVSSDVYLEYNGDFDDEMIDDAIDLILEAAASEVENKPTIH